jgi:hypothetical protein
MPKRRFLPWLLLLPLAAGPAPAANSPTGGQVQLAPWSGSTPPNVLRLDLSEVRPPRHGGVEAVVTLITADGREIELGRFAPTEGVAAGRVAVRVPLPSEAQPLAAVARNARVRVRLEPIYGSPTGARMSLRQARLERLD